MGFIECYLKIKGSDSIMKKICVCVLVVLAKCSKVFSDINPEYDTISPINLTINSLDGNARHKNAHK